MTITSTRLTAFGPNPGPRLVATVSAALLLLSAGVAWADPAKRPHPGKGEIKTVAVNAHYTEPAGSWDGAACSGLSTGSPTCRARNAGYATFTGTLYGEEYYDLEGTVTTDRHITYEGPAYVTGGVQGCGKGSYILEITNGYIDMKKYDPVTNSAPGFNEWSYRPGSGTGELTNLISGSGVNHWTIYWSGAAGVTPVEGEGDFTGTIRCGK